MKRAVFYTIVQKDEIIGLQQQDGFEFEMDGIQLNGYVSENDTVYIIDPTNGIAIFVRKLYETYRTELVAMKYARQCLRDDKDFVERWKTAKEKESYKLTVEMFDAYKKAEILREKQKEATRREMKEKEEQENE